MQAIHSENDTEPSQKLNSRQIALLKNGFPRVKDTPEARAKRSWYGKSLTQIAETFAQQEGKWITSRMVRYHYQQLTCDKDNPPTPLKRGRPAGSPNRHEATISAHDALRALTQAVWSLTRFSISDIHRLYKTIADQHHWKLPAIQNFRPIIKPLGIYPQRQTPSGNLMERYSIHVLRHQITPRKGSRNQWTVLAAIEHMTGCINLRIFKAKEGAQELSVTHIADFIEDTIDRLALPIKKVEISAVTLEVINELVNKLPNYQIQQGDATDTQARYPIPDNLSTAVKFCEFLSAAVNDHNDTYGKSKLIAERKEIYEEYQRVRDKKRRGWNLTKIKLMYPETPAGPLMTFCKRHFKTDAAVIMVRSLELRMRNPSQ